MPALRSRPDTSVPRPSGRTELLVDPHAPSLDSAPLVAAGLLP
ncbi:MAG TPA: hypothetical protein VFV42_12225 [Acidimicrobiales bacterium]|nr:hypothetical protein [Acidimicrobiales bacterium]